MFAECIDSKNLVLEPTLHYQPIWRRAKIQLLYMFMRKDLLLEHAISHVIA